MTERDIILKTFVETLVCLFYSCLSSAVSDDSLAHLMSMGFPLDLARNALSMTGENIEEAINLLISAPDRWVVCETVVLANRYNIGTDYYCTLLLQFIFTLIIVQ